MIQDIREKCGMSSIKDKPTVLYEDNSVCIAQIKGGYIKVDRTKHISPKFFYTHELQKNGDIDVRQTRSCDNLAVYSPRHFQHRPLKSWCIILECVSSKTCHVVLRGSHHDKDCTIFPSTKVFLTWFSLTRF